MRSCAGNRKRLSAYIDGELPKRARISVEVHLAECPACRLVFDELRGLAPLLQKYDAPPVPAGLSSRILTEGALRQRRKDCEKAAGSRWRELLLQPRLVRGATGVALVVGLVMGGWMGWTSHHSPDSGQWVARTNNESVASDMYAFDVLSAEPRGSIAATTLTLLDDRR